MRKDIAEDLTQDTLLLLHRKYDHLLRLEDLVPLAIRIVRYKAAAAWRKSRRHGEQSSVPAEEAPLPDFSSSPVARAEARELLEKMKPALLKLGHRCRQLFGFKLEGKNFSEIQEAMGAASLNTVYTWDHRCRQRLRELMGEP